MDALKINLISKNNNEIYILFLKNQFPEGHIGEPGFPT